MAKKYPKPLVWSVIAPMPRPTYRAEYTDPDGVSYTLFIVENPIPCELTRREWVLEVYQCFSAGLPMMCDRDYVLATGEGAILEKVSAWREAHEAS